MKELSLLKQSTVGVKEILIWVQYFQSVSTKEKKGIKPCFAGVSCHKTSK
jgi:hypothetical protein